MYGQQQQQQQNTGMSALGGGAGGSHDASEGVRAPASGGGIPPRLDPVPPAKKPKRKKVSQACVFCRRSHMTCDDGRPCQRCIRRKIAHLCTNEAPGPKPDSPQQQPPIHRADSSSSIAGTSTPQLVSNPASASTPANNLLYGFQNSFMQQISPQLPPTAANPINPVVVAAAAAAAVAASSASGGASTDGPHPTTDTLFPPFFPGTDGMGNELTIISEFLASLESPANNQGNPFFGSSASFAPPVQQQQQQQEQQQQSHRQHEPPAMKKYRSGSGASSTHSNGENRTSAASNNSTHNANPESLSSTERFVLTAADPMTVGTNEDRLNQVISAKFEAGLLKPYNYISSYTKLQAWMETHMSPASRTRILNVMGLFRPRFQWVAQRLTDMDLVLVEEAFERMLLEYDRVFSSMGIPSCLWRRTGEIWKCNKEFAQLVGLSMDELKDGRLSIYELMSEESAVNYWEKYGNIAFDAGQKAILTSCVLKKPDEDRESAAARTVKEGVNCCFSFTIRRDRYSIPIIIAGNFLPAGE